MMMSRFLFFGGDTHYPLGGWQDYKGDFRSVKDALREAAQWGWDWYHILDTQTGEIVEEHPKPAKK